MDYLKSNLKKYMFYILSALLVTFISSFLGINFEFKGIILPLIVLFGTLLIFMFAKGIIKIIMFYIFAIIQGLFLTPLINQQFKISLISIFGLTILIVGICMFIGYKQKNLSYLGSFLFVGLCIVIVYLLMSIFLPLPNISFLIILLFSIYVMYDFNRFKNRAIAPMNNQEILNEAMDLYLDILNIIVNLLDIFGDN